jgi:RNA polymerase sigma-70 factor, ECF subfamily
MQAKEGPSLTAPPDLAAFCRDQYPQLVGMLGLYCGDRVVAEELAQEALTRACRDWTKVRSKENPPAWLNRVAINLANSYYRRRIAERRANARLQSRPSAGVQRESDNALVLRQAIARLPRRQRTALVLHYYVDLTYAEVADFMSIPLSTAKMLAHRGLKRLRNRSDLIDPMEVPDVGRLS